MLLDQSPLQAKQVKLLRPECVDDHWQKPWDSEARADASGSRVETARQERAGEVAALS